MDWKRMARWGALVGVSLSVLTACTVSMSGGLFGALATIGVAVTVFLLAGATQTGCVEDPDPDPEVDAGADAGADAELDARVGPCLSQPLPDMDIGPCLSPLEPDMGDQGVEEHDLSIGPCLSPPEPDRGVERDMAPDMEIGPCLDVPAPDQGTTDPDAFLGPCLSPPQPEPEEGEGMLSPDAIDKAAVFDKVAASLPADIAARLKQRS